MFTFLTLVCPCLPSTHSSRSRRLFSKREEEPTDFKKPLIIISTSGCDLRYVSLSILVLIWQSKGHFGYWQQARWHRGTRVNSGGHLKASQSVLQLGAQLTGVQSPRHGPSVSGRSWLRGPRSRIDLRPRQLVPCSWARLWLSWLQTRREYARALVNVSLLSFSMTKKSVFIHFQWRKPKKGEKMK